MSAFALFAFKRQLYNVSIPIFLMICKDQHDKKLAEDRSQKAALALYKWSVYVFTSAVGFLILKDTEVLPWYLGGTGELANCFTTIPF